jgi:riboflavin transporter FmnP
MGGFALGPMAAVCMEFMKNVLNFLMNGTITAGIGELANFAMGCAFVVPASLFYKYHKTLKGAIVSLIIGTSALVVVGCVVNYFVMIPAYVTLANFPLDAILGMASKVNGLVSSLETMILFAVAPFNLVKGIVCSVINLLLYKRLSKVLHI